MPDFAFCVIGENIHCTRIVKRDGRKVGSMPDGRNAIVFTAEGRVRYLPIAEPFLASADWDNGKVKHCGVAVWQGLYGSAAEQELGAAYIRHLAVRQAEAGAGFLDLNVDEFGSGQAERIRAMEWMAGVAQSATRLPLSIDSSNPEVIRAGLARCDRQRGRPLVNSLSLERIELLETVIEQSAAVVASAAGAAGLPADSSERLANLDQLLPLLHERGVASDRIYVDPLVYTISTDPGNGAAFLATVQAVRAKYGPAIHIVGGLSNVSFGMPGRKLINQVFARLAVAAGADGGIVDPLQINAGILRGLDLESEPFRLARALLTGEDEFGLAFIEAHRAGRLP